MAHEPTLEVYKVTLQTYGNKKAVTFRDYLIALEPSLENSFSLQKAFSKYFEHFISQIDNSYYKSEKRKKAMGVKPKKRGTQINRTITLNSTQQYISGTIKGGRYGQHRSLGNIDKPETAHKRINNSQIVLDDFFFLFYSPVGSNKGLLMIQSYTDDNIKDIFISFIRQLLKVEGFTKPLVTIYCPNDIQEEFKKSSIVKELKYQRDILVSNIDTKNTIRTKELSIEIRITAKEEGEKLSKFPSFRSLAEKFSFKPKRKEILLEEFTKKTGKLVSDGHTSTFELDSNFAITPTIYLRGRIALQKDDTPNWKSLASYCAKLIEELKKEVYPENEVS